MGNCIELIFFFSFFLFCFIDISNVMSAEEQGSTKIEIKKRTVLRVFLFNQCIPLHKSIQTP